MAVSQLSEPDNTGDDDATPFLTLTWQHYPHMKEPKEVLIIGSFGDCTNLEQRKLVRSIIYYRIHIICDLDTLYHERYFQIISLMNGEGKRLRNLQTFTKEILNVIILN